MTTLTEALTYTVLVGGSIPAHDATFDFAEEIAEALAAFHGYVALVRDVEQADAALLELADAIQSAARDLTREARHDRQH